MLIGSEMFCILIIVKSQFVKQELKNKIILLSAIDNLVKGALCQ